MKILSFILLVLASLGLTSCYKEKYEGNLIKKDIPLVAVGDEYKLNDSMMTAYFYENGNVPLVSIDEFINSLDGYFVASSISRSNVLFSNRVRYSWKYGSALLTLEVDYEKDTIKVNDMYFFNFTKPMAGVDIMAYLKQTDYQYHGNNSASFDLQKYGFDILNYNDEILVPINILNNLFLATNVTNIIYNGDKFVFVPHYISKSQVKEFRKSSLNGKNAPEDVRIANNKGLYFAMDYFYGLNEVKGFTNGFEEALKLEPDLYTKLNSTDPLENRDAYIGIFMHLLDELHSSADYLSYYMPDGIDEIDIWHNLGPYWTDYYKLDNKLMENYLAKFEHLKVLRYEGNTAFIKFNDFNLGWDDIIYDEDGNLKPDAWKNDTFELMYKVMEMIKAKKEIKNIVIDLSNNGGGYVAGMIKALGFLTNKPIELPEDNSLTGFESTAYFRTDTNKDGKYDANDGYPNYNWNILVSGNTFSAANTFTSVCKDMKIAKIIGKPTAGGMCSVMQLVLLDGTVLRLSSERRSRSKVVEDGKVKLLEIETGIKPDYDLEYDKFYDLAYINQFINNNYQEKEN